MEINVTDIEDCRKEFNAKLTYEELLPHFEKAYIRERKKIKIDGFRPGKVPMSIVKQRFSEMIEFNECEDIAQKVLNDYLKNEKIRFAGKGELADMDYKPKEHLTFKITFEYFPDFELKQYKGIELTKIKYVIDDSIIDEELHNLIVKSAGRELDGLVLDKEYMVTIDFQELDEAGSELIGQSGKDLKIYVGDAHLDKEMYEAVKDIKEEEERVVNLNHEDGTKHKYRIKAVKVEKLIFPEINKEFLKKITGRDDLENEDDLKNHLRKSFEDSYEDISDNNLEDSVVNELVKLNDVKIPSHYVDTVLDNEYEEYLKNQKPDKEEKEILSKEDFSKERRAGIIFYSKWFEIKDKIIETEKLELTDEIKLKSVEKDAEKYRIPADKLLTLMEKQKDFLAKAEDYMVMDYLKTNAFIKTEEKVIKAHSHDESENKIIT